MIFISLSSSQNIPNDALPHYTTKTGLFTHYVATHNNIPRVGGKTQKDKLLEASG